MTGTVKYYDGGRGFGFIKLDNGSSADVFVHHTAVNSAHLRYAICTGSRIAFDVTPDRRGIGLKAVNLKLIDAGAA
jgi:CspA family cold shock protein